LSTIRPSQPDQPSALTDAQDYSVEDLAKFSGIKYVPFEELDPDIRQYVETRFREPAEQTTSPTNKGTDSCGICERTVNPGDEAMNDGSVFPEETKLHFDCVRMLYRSMRGVGMEVPEGLLRSVPFDDGSPITINTDGP